MTPLASCRGFFEAAYKSDFLQKNVQKLHAFVDRIQAVVKEVFQKYFSGFFSRQEHKRPLREIPVERQLERPVLVPNGQEIPGLDPRDQEIVRDMQRSMDSLEALGQTVEAFVRETAQMRAFWNQLDQPRS